MLHLKLVPKLSVDLVNGQLDGHGAFPQGVTFTGMEQLRVWTYGGADTILGGDLADRLEVGGGANTVMAGAGDDLVGYVNTDASTLDGGTGEDTLEVGAGTSSLYFIVDTSDGSVDDGQLSFISSFEYYAAYGGQFDDIASLGSRDDSFRGGFGSDTAFGAGGNDTLIGDQGNDLLSGGDGNDRLVGNSGNDTLTGGDGDDRLAGGIGLDVIDAGAGNDRIAFYLGNDTASGGSGDDWFLFTRNQNGFHTITDFESGADTLGFTGIFLQFGPASGALDPALLSFGTASGTPAQFILTYSMVSDLTTLLWDPNGTDPSGGAYAICMFQGNVSLTAQDFFIL